VRESGFSPHARVGACWPEVWERGASSEKSREALARKRLPVVESFQVLGVVAEHVRGKRKRRGGLGRPKPQTTGPGRGDLYGLLALALGMAPG